MYILDLLLVSILSSKVYNVICREIHYFLFLKDGNFYIMAAIYFLSFFELYSVFKAFLTAYTTCYTIWLGLHTLQNISLKILE